MKIPLIILAAGKSTRMRQNKLLMKLETTPIISRVVLNGLKSKASEVIVVLGHEKGKIREALKDLKCRIVVNQNYESGQSSSVKVGLSAVKSYADAVLILPGDCALVTNEHINAVIDQYERNASPIVVAAHQGRSGHPILLDRKLFDEVMTINEETFGLKAVISRYRDQSVVVESQSDSVLIDIDTPDDYEKIKQRS